MLSFNISYVSNPESFETAVELLVPELQRRGLMWRDYAAPGVTFRENLHRTPGKPYLRDDHPESKTNGIAVLVKEGLDETVTA